MHDCAGARSMISIDEALAAYARELRPLPAAGMDLRDAHGLVLAEPAHSEVDLPLFTQSAVDGYAIRSEDLLGANARAPVSLRLAGGIAAGETPRAPLRSGECARILTGAALPDGADAVARQEIVRRDGDAIVIAEPCAPGTDTRHRGEELRRGERIADAGARIDAGLYAALSMAGVRQVRVRRVPRIAALVTGDEVALPGAVLEPGQIHDANGPLIRGWFAERGFGQVDVVYVRDTPEAVAAALRAALDSADLVISSGGVSVGDRDYLPEIAPQLGVRKVFWQVSQKPGKPLWFGVREGGGGGASSGASALMGLPGNPAAVLVGLAVHAAAALAVLAGTASQPAWRSGVLAAAVRSDAHRDRLVRAALEDDGSGRALLRVLPRQDSHMLSNLATAQALVRLPARGEGFVAGEVVRWVSLR